ncbi:hypothetical protein LCGC14_2275620 [marine sediment metagenome]|uniref:Uncharacterized protein n=1 Tax=marine sediment metagenome TaxID=412755 RepID=A0A0F9DHW1_9ZZZZ
MKGTFFFKRHQHKDKAFVKALEVRDYARWPFMNFPDLFFYDHEHGEYGYGINNQLDMVFQKKRPVFIVPHTGRAGYPYTLREAWPHAVARFVFSEGSKKMYEMCKVPGPIEVIGWAWSAIYPFIEPNIGEKMKILFCPIHPNENGFLHKIDRTVNHQTLRAMARMKNVADIKVRYLQALEHQGLWVEDGIEYVKGDPDGSLKEVGEADVVIGAYTLAYLSIARGKPTIMIGEHEKLHSGNTKQLMKWTNTEHLWKDYVKYPYNFEEVFYDADDVYKMIGEVLRYSEEVEAWSSLFVGDPFDPDKFVDIVEGYLDGQTNKFLQQDLHEINKLPGSIVEPHFVPKEG